MLSGTRVDAIRQGLLDEMRRLIAELGRVPRAIDLQGPGRPSCSTVRKYCGSLSQAVEQAGFVPRPRGRPSYGYDEFFPPTQPNRAASTLEPGGDSRASGVGVASTTEDQQ